MKAKILPDDFKTMKNEISEAMESLVTALSETLDAIKLVTKPLSLLETIMEQYQSEVQNASENPVQ
jgi:septation ring formation regulator EzrA